jgi:hypothetical protein
VVQESDHEVDRSQVLWFWIISSEFGHSLQRSRDMVSGKASLIIWKHLALIGLPSHLLTFTKSDECHDFSVFIAVEQYHMTDLVT